MIDNNESDYDVNHSLFVTARALISMSRICLPGVNHHVGVIDVDVAVELGVMLTVDACMQYALYSAVVIGFSTVTVTVTVLCCDLGHHGHGNTGKLCLLMCCTIFENTNIKMKTSCVDVFSKVLVSKLVFLCCAERVNLWGFRAKCQKMTAIERSATEL